MTQTPRYLERPGQARLAYHLQPGNTPGVMFCGGLRSDMTGSKAMALEAHALSRRRGFTRFDYTGHGASGGRFDDATVSVWLADALAVFDALTQGPQVLVGSSMGGWIALLVARARPQRVRGLVLVAPASDFTRAVRASLDQDARAALAHDGRFERPSAYSPEPYVFTRALLEDGERHCLLDAPVHLPCAVHILHGTADADVPWQRSLTLLERLKTPEVLVTFVKDGDHRLSTPADLERLCAATDESCNRVPGA